MWVRIDSSCLRSFGSGAAGTGGATGGVTGGEGVAGAGAAGAGGAGGVAGGCCADAMESSGRTHAAAAMPRFGK